LAHLKLTDIDSERMVVHIHNGKGRRDRDVVLSPHLLDELRQHYRRLARKPATWLFPGGQRHTAD
jgi:integrase/recombinase XerD